MSRELWVVGIGAVLALAACPFACGEGGLVVVPQCQQPTGEYQVELVELVGNCGAREPFKWELVEGRVVPEDVDCQPSMGVTGPESPPFGTDPAGSIPCHTTAWWECDGVTTAWHWQGVWDVAPSGQLRGHLAVQQWTWGQGACASLYSLTAAPAGHTVPVEE